MVEPPQSWLARWLTIGIRRPGWALWGVVLVAVVSLSLVVLGPLEVSTSRRNLVSLSSPHQARLFRYYEQFGRPDVAILVVSGSDAEQRRKLVDAFQAELRSDSQLQDRTLSKLDVESVAETLLLWRPELLEALVDLESPSGGSSDHWVRWARALETRVVGQLENGREGTSAAGGSSAFDPVAALIQSLSRAVETETSLTLPKIGPELSGGQVDEYGYITSGPHHLVLIFPDLPSDEGNEVSPIVDRIRAARDRARQQLETRAVEAKLTGLAALATDELRAIRSGTRLTSIVSTGGILLVLLLAFRSLWHPVAALVPLLAGIAISLGFVQLVYGQLNLVTSSFMSVLLGLGIDFGVHLLHRYGEARGKGGAVKSALEQALLLTGPGVAAGALTTVVAFLTTTTTRFAAFRQLGVITAFGLAAMLVSAFLLFPALLPKLAGRSRLQLREIPGTAALVSLSSRAARPIVGGAGLLTLLGIVFVIVQPPSFNGRYIEFLPRGAESYVGLSRLERGAQFSPAEVHFGADSFEQAAALTRRLRQSPLIGQVQSPADLAPELDAARLAALREAASTVPRGALKLATEPGSAEARIAALTDLGDALDEVAYAMRQASLDSSKVERASEHINQLLQSLQRQPDSGQAALDRISDQLRRSFARAERALRDVAERGRLVATDLPPLFHHRFVSENGERLAVHAQPAGDAWDPAFAERFARQVRNLDPEAAGLALNVVPHQEYITSGFARAALLSFGIVLLILRVIFRRWSDALLAMLPVTLGFAWMLSLMRPLGIQFTSANMVALPLLLGIGLDAGIHIVHRCREAECVVGAASVRELLRGTGAAVCVAAVTTMVGFSALMLAAHRAMSGLGLLLTLGIGLSLVASVLVLPAALVLLGRLR